MPYIRYYAISEPSLFNDDDPKARHRSGSGPAVLELLRLRLLRGFSRLSVSDKPDDLTQSNSWVFIPLKSRLNITESSYTPPITRAGPNTPHRNRRSVKTLSHAWTQRQLAHVLPRLSLTCSLVFGGVISHR